MHILLAIHLTPPAATVEAYAQLARLLILYLVAPLPEATHSPLGSVLVGVGAYGTTTKAVAQNIEMLHRAVILTRHLHNLLHCGILTPANGGQQRKCQNK